MANILSHSAAEKANGNKDNVAFGVQLDSINASEVLMAAKAEEDEHRMSLWEALRKHKKAAAWSAALSAGLVMEGKLPDASTPIIFEQILIRC